MRGGAAAEQRARAAVQDGRHVSGARRSGRAGLRGRPRDAPAQRAAASRCSSSATLMPARNAERASPPRAARGQTRERPRPPRSGLPRLSDSANSPLSASAASQRSALMLGRIQVLAAAHRHEARLGLEEERRVARDRHLAGRRRPARRSGSPCRGRGRTGRRRRSRAPGWSRTGARCRPGSRRRPGRGRRRRPRVRRRAARGP